MIAALGELPAELETDTAIRTGDERGDHGAGKRDLASRCRAVNRQAQLRRSASRVRLGLGFSLGLRGHVLCTPSSRRTPMPNPKSKAGRDQAIHYNENVAKYASSGKAS